MDTWIFEVLIKVRDDEIKVLYSGLDDIVALEILKNNSGNGAYMIAR